MLPRAAVLATVASTALGNSFAPPVQLHPCSAAGAASQRWTFGRNGSIYSLDDAGTRGYCLDVTHGQGGAHNAAAGAAIMAADCGDTTSLWAMRGSTVLSLQPDTPFCLGIPPTNTSSGTWDPMSVVQRAQLTNCSAPGAQFHVAKASSSAAVATSHSQHSSSGGGAPTLCKVNGADVSCYITKGGGPCGPGCPGPPVLPFKAPTPHGLQMSWELCARLCYNLNQSTAGIEYGGQCTVYLYRLIIIATVLQEITLKELALTIRF